MNSYDNNLEKMNREELQDYLKEDFVKQCIAKYNEFKELFDPYLVTNEVDKIPFEEWEYVIGRMRHDGVKFVKEKAKPKTFKHMPIFDIYDNEKLEQLYNINCIPAITQYFINEIKRNAVKGTIEPFINLSEYGSQYKNKYENEAFIYRLASNTADKKMHQEKQRYDLEYEKLSIKRQACLAISEILVNEKEQPEVFEFVCNCLQYVSLEDLEKLMQLSRNGFKEVKQGRPKKDVGKKIVIMYNKDGEIENKFEDRQACIEAIGISKQMLSHVLTGKKPHWKGYKFAEQKNEQD